MFSLFCIAVIALMVIFMLSGVNIVYCCAHIVIFSVLLYLAKSGKALSLYKYISNNWFFFCCVCAAVLFFGAWIQITLGIQKNDDVLKIKEQGIKTTAKIVGSEEKFQIVRTDSLLVVYYVKFDMNGKEVMGKTVSQERYIPDKEADIYYMPYASGDMINVAFADFADEPGNNQIGHGIWLLFFGAAFIIEIIDCVREKSKFSD